MTTLLQQRYAASVGLSPAPIQKVVVLVLPTTGQPLISAQAVHVAAGSVTVCASVQGSTTDSLSSAASRQQPPAVGLAGEDVPAEVWQLCGVPANLQATSMVATADALLQLDGVHCPLEVVTCLQHADQAIAQAVGHIR